MLNNASSPQTGALLRSSAWAIQRRVIVALMIRELLTRYGRNNIGFLWLVVEPTIFIVVLALAWTAARGNPNAGLPIVAFAITGYPSLLLWRSTTSRCLNAVQSNKTLLYHRQVTILDIFIARIFLELIAISITLLALTTVFYLIGWLQLPEDPLQAAAGWLLLCWFGAGLAMTVGSLSEKADFVSRIWHPIQYLLMMVSGVAFVVDALPAHTQRFLLWVPMMNAVEFMREGWFGSKFTAHYDLPYLIACDVGMTMLGIAMVRQIGFDSRDE